MSLDERVPFLSVQIKSGSEVEERLQELDYLETSRKIKTTKGRVYFPLKREIVMSAIFPGMDTKEWLMGFREFSYAKHKGSADKKENTRRTIAERVESIFDFIDRQSEPFPKSELQAIGLNPSSADKWLSLIEYIQSQPMIRVTRIGSSTYIERLENRYLSMLRKRILNPSLSLKERSQTMDDYINALITLEKIEDGRIKE